MGVSASMDSRRIRSVHREPRSVWRAQVIEEEVVEMSAESAQTVSHIKRYSAVTVGALVIVTCRRTLVRYYR